MTLKPNHSTWSLYRPTLIHILVSSLVVLAAALIFALRYLPAFQEPNFYAEDGRIFTNNILYKGPIQALFSGFNGYLVVGQYLLLDLAVGIYKLLNLSFYQLPAIIAGVSCLFLGLTVSLPYILFRRQLGRPLAIAAVIVGSFMAMPSFDYAIIGTIGNLKFLFMYWAALLLFYRHLNTGSVRRRWLADGLLLLCIFTFAPVMALLPAVLFSYRSELRSAWRRHSLRPLLTRETASLAGLLVISLVYVVVVYIKGIPKLPGYLDTPYEWQATAKIAYRSTWYAWLSPASGTMRDLITVGLLAIFGYFGMKRQSDRLVVGLGLWAILVASASFVYNRPGVSEYFLTYGPNPDQFFYAQALIFTFLSIWMLRRIPLNSARRLISLVAVTGLYLWWVAPYSGSFGESKAIYGQLGTAQTNLAVACQQAGPDINFQIYPSPDWRWTIAKEKACN